MGVLLAGALLAGAAGLYFAYAFIHGEVSAQLSAQHITLPAEESPAFQALSTEDQDAIRPFAGQQVTTGEQAGVFANHYIAAHLKNIGNGLSYAELSEAARANPNDTELAAKVDTVFKGETLRGMLLNAYAFGTMATVAKLASLGALLVGIILLVLSFFGFRHAKKASTAKRPVQKKRS